METGGLSFAIEGTAAHFLADLILSQPVVLAARHTAADYLGRYILDDSITHHRGDAAVRITHEMVQSIQRYVDYVQALPGKFFPEHLVDFSEWVPGGFGTADGIILNGSHLSIVDLKYGVGTRVHARDNPQLMLYALGAYSDYRHRYDVQTVTLVVHQPRLDHVSEWTLSLAELLDWATQLPAAAAMALDVDAPLRPGAAQCRFCRGQSRCGALGDWVANLCRDASGEIRNVEEMSDADALQVYNSRTLIKGFSRAVKSQLQADLAEGDIPGLKLVPGRRRRVWVDPFQMSLDLADIATLSDFSVYAVERALGVGHPLIEDLVTRRRETSSRMVCDSDPRPSADLTEGFDAVGLDTNNT